MVLRYILKRQCEKDLWLKINLSFIKNIFTSKTGPTSRPYDILVKYHKSAKYGDKSLIPLGLKIWNQVLSNVKSLTSIAEFKEYIGPCFRSGCKCNICRMI